MSRAADDFDGLTTAFLGSGSRGRITPRVQAMPMVLVVGNVPTLAGIWIAQYADQVARTSGPVALIRLDGVASRAEVYRAQGRAMPLDGNAWLERASAFARGWIVCVDSRTSATELLEARCALTLMSGTDETAIAAAKRTIEAIVQAASTVGQAPPEIGLVFVGSAEDVAQSAARGLIAWALERSMGVALSMVAHAPRVDRVESTGPVPLAMLSGLDLGAATEYVSMAMAGNPNRFDAARNAPPPESNRVTASPPYAQDAVSTSLPAAAPLPKPLPSELAAVYFSQLSALPFTCPDASSVVLALDESGALHLIQMGNTQHALRVTASWARANWMLIVAACPRLQTSPPNIVEHLLLDDARDAAPLHRTGVLLHARMDVSVGSAFVRQRIDLNDAASAGLPSS
ncbi:MAG: hypothetical protein EXS15_01635 [Phycisphaerales bacterium]|nr:hypothetical protein [Phycisphaerales bacterium]